jgi:dUTPase
MVQLEFTKIREVKSPNRANDGDAGLDFYIPKLTVEDILKVGEKHDKDFTGINRKMYGRGNLKFSGIETEGLCVVVNPGGRILIPSGIKVLINPKESMLMAANKSGVATKDGLTFTAEIVDSPYTGEMHIGIQNASNEPVYISLREDKKIMQFVHVPIILSTPVEITNEEYEEKAKNWGTRGDKGFGAHDNK